MKTEISLKKDWTVTPEAFDKLLAWLDDDREIAGAKYEKIRQKLIKLFKWRGCTPEEEYADITINRVTRRIAENVAVDVSNPYLYFHGTALNVIREFWRGRQKHPQEEIEKVDSQLLAENLQQKLEQDDREAQDAARYDCMQKCLRELPAETRDFIVGYHHGASRKDVRKQLAEKLNVSLNVLRIRACRIRDSLQKCAEKCLKQKS